MPSPSLSLDQQRRYARQIMLPEVGTDGQLRLANIRVLVVGAGGLGAAVISYLAAAGVGHLGIIDHDRVELSNLSRQIIHETGDVGRLKVESAADRVHELNPDCHTTIYPVALSTDNASEIIRNYDIVADGCDNFASRFAVNAACVALKKPLVSAAIAGFHGQLMTVMEGHACYACVVSADATDANTCRESGVIGPLAGIIGSMQALEVLRVILGTPALAGKLQLYNGHDATSRIVTLMRDPSCPFCAKQSVTKPR